MRGRTDHDRSGLAARPVQQAEWDHSTDDRFFAYYAQESQSAEALGRFRRIRDAILRVTANGSPPRVLTMADIGCGAGTQSLIWAEAGHLVHALDVNERLVNLGRERAGSAGHTIDFQVGSATALPWADASMDVCIALELLEHVAEWEGCLREFVRVLRPGGALFLTTTNSLCPLQSEFNLPLYSWYPSRLKRRYEALSMTTRPELANFARYPAVNWFNFYQLRSYLARFGFRSLDRFDLIDTAGKSRSVRVAVSGIRALPPLRLLAHLCNPCTMVLAVKTGRR